MKIGYARVSTNAQNLENQISLLTEARIDLKKAKALIIAGLSIALLLLIVIVK